MTYLRKRVFSLLLLLLFVQQACGAADGQPDGPEVRPIRDKWAVVIGVDSFKDDRIPKLKFASKDAKDFADFLVTKGNFAPDHVRLLLNENATEDSIQSALGDDWLPRRVLPGDLVLIYASSHGSPIDVAGDNFLIAYDTNRDRLFSTAIRIKDLAQTVKRRSGCDRMVLILDACHSGTADTGGKAIYRTSNFDVDSIVGEGEVVLSSSEKNQRSWESLRYENGVFTRRLIDALFNKGKSTVMSEAYQHLKDAVEREVRFDRKQLQTPVMKDNWKGKALSLLAKPANPRSVEPPPSVSAPSLRSARKEAISEPPSEKKLPNRIAVLPFAGPLEKKVDYIVKSTQSKKTLKDIPDMSQLLQYELSQKLYKNYGKQVLLADTTKTILNKVPLPPQMSAEDWKRLGKSLQARYIVTGTIDKLVFKQRFWTGNDFILQASTAVVDGNTGKTLVQLKNIQVKKWPWVSDQFGYNSYWSNVIVPALAEKITGQLFVMPPNEKSG